MTLEDAEHPLVQPRRVPELHRRADRRRAVPRGRSSSRASSRSIVGWQLEQERPGAVAEQAHPPLDDLGPAAGRLQPPGVGQGARRLDRHLEPRREPVVPPRERAVPGPSVVARVELDRREPAGVVLQPASLGHTGWVERPGPAAVRPSRGADEDRHHGILPRDERSGGDHGERVVDGVEHPEEGAEHGRVTVGLNARVRPSPFLHRSIASGGTRTRPRVVRMPEPTSEPRSEPTGRPRTAVLSATLAVVALVGGWTWAAAVQPGGFDSGSESISALAASGTPHRWIMTTALVLTGSGPPRHGVGPGSRPPRRPGTARRRWGRDPRRSPAAASLAHRLVGGAHRRRHRVVRAARRLALVRGTTRWTVGDAEPGGAPRGRPDGHRRGVARTRPRRQRCSASTSARSPSSPWPGHSSRQSSTWWWAGHRIGSRRVRHGLAVVGLTVACAVAGTSATAVAPATAQTLHYQASVTLDRTP